MWCTSAKRMCERVTDECPVCFESLQHRITAQLPCSHTTCLSCLMRLPIPQSCPMCRFSIVHLIPRFERSSSPTVVTLNVSTRTTAPHPLETVQTLSERVRVAEHLADAIRHVGAAPRNSRQSSYTIVPFDDGGTFSHRLNSLINTSGVNIVPPPDEDDGSSIAIA